MDWSEETESKSLHDMDAGIMPITEDAFSRGKCGLKLIQYMACGLPVLASPVGENQNIVVHGENGFLARDAGEWADGIRSIATDHGQRSRMGMAGRKLVEEKYSVSVQAPRLIRIMYEACGRPVPQVNLSPERDSKDS